MRNGSRTMLTVDDRWIVPYSPWLLRQFKCSPIKHIPIYIMFISVITALSVYFFASVMSDPTVSSSCLTGTKNAGFRRFFALIHLLIILKHSYFKLI